MIVVGHGDRYAVEFLAFDHLPKVRVLSGIRVFGPTSIENLGIHVAQGRNISPSPLNVFASTPPIPARPITPHVQLLVGRVAARHRRQDHESSSGCFQRIAPRHAVSFFDLFQSLTSKFPGLEVELQSELDIPWAVALWRGNEAKRVAGDTRVGGGQQVAVKGVGCRRPELKAALFTRGEVLQDRQVFVDRPWTAKVIKPERHVAIFEGARYTEGSGV
jgi:hypothetical protein